MSCVFWGAYGGTCHTNANSHVHAQRASGPLPRVATTPIHECTPTGCACLPILLYDTCSTCPCMYAVLSARLCMTMSLRMLMRCMHVHHVYSTRACSKACYRCHVKCRVRARVCVCVHAMCVHATRARVCVCLCMLCVYVCVHADDAT